MTELLNDYHIDIWDVVMMERPEMIELDDAELEAMIDEWLDGTAEGQPDW